VLAFACAAGQSDWVAECRAVLLTNEVGEIMQPTQFVWLLPGVGVKIRSQLCWNENRKVD
jgi:hypothetical protein